MMRVLLQKIQDSQKLRKHVNKLQQVYNIYYQLRQKSSSMNWMVFVVYLVLESRRTFHEVRKLFSGILYIYIPLFLLSLTQIQNSISPDLLVLKKYIGKCCKKLNFEQLQINILSTSQKVHFYFREYQHLYFRDYKQVMCKKSNLQDFKFLEKFENQNSNLDDEIPK